MARSRQVNKVAAKKRTSHAKHATAVPVPDRHMICQGSGITHAQAFLRVMQGENFKFVRCVIPECKAVTFYSGPKWDEVDFGLTREQITKMNSGALIL
jgi:hypothetical protein